MLLLGNDARRDGAYYSVVDAHAGRQIAHGELDMRVSKVSGCSHSVGTCQDDGGPWLVDSMYCSGLVVRTLTVDCCVGWVQVFTLLQPLGCEVEQARVPECICTRINSTVQRINFIPLTP